MISSLCERFYGFCFLLRGFPDFSIYPWCPFALVFSHPFNSKSFTAKGVGQQVLQRLDFAPLALLLGLYDTHLKPPHLLIDCLPVYGMPVSLLVGSRTSSWCFCRHLHCLLCRLVKFSRKERPDGSLPAFAWSLCASYPSHYRMAFACSILLCPQSHRQPLRTAFPLAGRLRIYHVLLTYHETG